MNRADKFFEDCQNLLPIFQESVEFVKTDFFASRDEFSLKVSFIDDCKKRHRLEVCACEEYPESGTIFSCLSCAEQNDEPIVMDGTVSEIFSYFSGEHGLPDNLHLSIRGTGASVCTESDDEEYLDSSLESASFECCQSVDLLQKEADEIVSRSGSTAVQIRRFGDDHADVIMLIDCSALKGFVRDAWHLDPEEPLALKLIEVPIKHYRESKLPPKVKVYIQSDENRVFAVGKQLEKITQSYLSEHWQATEDPGRRNFLLQLRRMLVRRLPTLSDFCLICDQKHESSMVMLSVCNRDLCTFAWDELGLMADVGAVARELDVIVLLLGLLQSAAFSSRHALILDPFPLVRDPLDHEKLCLDPDTKDIEKLRDVLMKLPCAQMLAASNDVAGCLKDSHIWAWRLLCWTVSSNRAYLVKLKHNDMIRFIATPFQFLMITDNPAKELKFRKAKEEHGESIFLFHGSPIENWHSILRYGLVNVSGTKKQVHGAVLGNGIYLSPSSSMSLEYSSGIRTQVPRKQEGEFQCVKRGLSEHCCTDGGKYLKLGAKMTCLAICEVVDTPDQLVKYRDGRWLLKEPDHCCTRFLFVYPEDVNVNQLANVDLTSPHNLHTLRQVVAKFMERNNIVDLV